MLKFFSILLFLCSIALAQNSGTFTDVRDNKTYKWVKIGKQVWMAQNLNYEAGNSCCYDNKPENCEKYGRLYDWDAAMKICPEGWHLPSNEEWDESGNMYSISALPGGANVLGVFGGIGFNGSWWSSKEYGIKFAYYKNVDFLKDIAYLSNNSKDSGFSVRCVRDVRQ